MSSALSVFKALEPLVGLPLSIARSAADMRVFHFGKVRPAANGKGTVGEYALHIQCPWRLVGKEGLRGHDTQLLISFDKHRRCSASLRKIGYCVSCPRNLCTALSV